MVTLPFITWAFDALYQKYVNFYLTQSGMPYCMNPNWITTIEKNQTARTISFTFNP